MPESDATQELYNELVTSTKLDANKLTPDQKAKTEAIVLAVGVLNEAKVSYTLFASPDTPSDTMKVIESHRLSYASDVETITRETPLARRATLWGALKTFSIGLKGLIAIADEKGLPMCAWDNGKLVSFTSKGDIKSE